MLASQRTEFKLAGDYIELYSNGLKNGRNLKKMLSLESITQSNASETYTQYGFDQ